MGEKWEDPHPNGERPDSTQQARAGGTRLAACHHAAVVFSCICSSRCIDALSLATVAPSSASRPHKAGLNAGLQRT